ncbi:MAG: GNAT family N-acetyltransferase [Candidatus Promineifilaceae bacterium]
MNAKELLTLYDLEQRINIEYPGVRKKRLRHLIRYIDESGGRHFILYSKLDGLDVDHVIAEEQQYFSQIGAVEWKVYEHDLPKDLHYKLAAYGFEVEEPESVMVLDLQQTPYIESQLGDDVSVQRLENALQLKEVRDIEEAVWGEDMGWIISSLGADLEIPGYLSVYTAYVGGKPACAGWIKFHSNGVFADLWGGSTLYEYRGRGLYTAVLAARVREAASRGYRYLTIDSSPMSRPIVARHGFQLLTTAWACKWKP